VIFFHSFRWAWKRRRFRGRYLDGVQWTVTAATSTHEVEVSGWIAPGDDAVGGTTVLRAPTDDAAAGMAPLCRESFKGTVRVSLWERDAAATWEGSGGGGDRGVERWRKGIWAREVYPGRRGVGHGGGGGGRGALV
jgi:hypothetical protein